MPFRSDWVGRCLAPSVAMGSNDPGLPAGTVFLEHLEQCLALAVALVHGGTFDLELSWRRNLPLAPNGGGDLSGRETEPRLEAEFRRAGGSERSTSDRDLGGIVHRSASQLAGGRIPSGSGGKAGETREATPSDFRRLSQTAKRTGLNVRPQLVRQRGVRRRSQKGTAAPAGTMRAPHCPVTTRSKA